MSAIRLALLASFHPRQPVIIVYNTTLSASLDYRKAQTSKHCPRCLQVQKMSLTFRFLRGLDRGLVFFFDSLHQFLASSGPCLEHGGYRSAACADSLLDKSFCK